MHGRQQQIFMEMQGPSVTPSAAVIHSITGDPADSPPSSAPVISCVCVCVGCWFYQNLRVSCVSGNPSFSGLLVRSLQPLMCVRAARLVSDMQSWVVLVVAVVVGWTLHHTWHPDTHSSSATASSPSFASCSNVIGRHFNGVQNWFGFCLL